MLAREAYRIRDGGLAKSRVRSDGPDLNAQGTLPAYLTRFVVAAASSKTCSTDLSRAID